jgi:hypothetical protein
LPAQASHSSQVFRLKQFPTVVGYNQTLSLTAAVLGVDAQHLLSIAQARYALDENLEDETLELGYRESGCLSSLLQPTKQEACSHRLF